MAKTTVQETRLEGKPFASRYFTIGNEGHEIYTENLGTHHTMASWAQTVAIRLRKVKEAMPKGTWTAHIEQQWKERMGRISDRSLTRYERVQVFEDGKVGPVERSSY